MQTFLLFVVASEFSYVALLTHGKARVAGWFLAHDFCSFLVLADTPFQVDGVDDCALSLSLSLPPSLSLSLFLH